MILFEGGTSPYAWARLTDETEHDHSLLATWIDFGPKRTFEMMARATMIPEERLRQVARANNWADRTAQYETYRTSILSSWTEETIRASEREIVKCIDVVARDQIGKLLQKIASPTDDAEPMELLERLRKLSVVKGAFKPSKEAGSGAGGAVLNLQLVDNRVVENKEVTVVSNEKAIDVEPLEIELDE